jgi:hypothetical protein
MHLPIINTCARAGAQVPMILLRILLVVLIVPPVWLAMSLLTAGTRLNAPLQPWRAALLRPLLRFWADALMRIGFGFWRYRVTGAAPRGTKYGYTPTSVCVRARALHTHPRLRRRGSWSAVATAGRSLARCESVRGGPPSHDAPRQQPARVRSAGLSRCSGAAAAKPGPSAVKCHGRRAPATAHIRSSATDGCTQPRAVRVCRKPACGARSLLSTVTGGAVNARAGWEHVHAAEACRALIVFNHVTYVDGIVLGRIFLPSGLANTSVARIPFFGSVTRVRPLGPAARCRECYNVNVPHSR